MIEQLIALLNIEGIKSKSEAVNIARGKYELHTTLKGKIKHGNKWR